MEWHFKTFNELTTQELYNILKERVAVFVVEQECPYPEVDGHDVAAHHLYLEQDGKIAAYLRVLPQNTIYPEVSLGRVLVAKDFRGQGLAKELIDRALRFVDEEWQVSTVKIQAQDYLRQFYGAFGFEPISEVYLEDNIPHVDMKRTI
ncbi:GNAT family N-acetyltransferase [Ammoniphilus sp. CFH 90114]|uniref:GNAT family N-acetyltransferase n=1 Tax=Ammoniphilus sp. CFH 90114 TaxID=2493665 RepID=UPI00100FD68D|nr:GNAT family N-acetyltransferase [Ammoniphilus sp. CFH 90114]RXT15382.1 GNAT family N-acetyltransferase [Ammoniphilus sp. CFH 90114]